MTLSLCATGPGKMLLQLQLRFSRRRSCATCSFCTDHMLHLSVDLAGTSVYPSRHMLRGRCYSLHQLSYSQCKLCCACLSPLANACTGLLHAYAVICIGMGILSLPMLMCVSATSPMARHLLSFFSSCNCCIVSVAVQRCSLSLLYCSLVRCLPASPNHQRRTACC